MKILSILFLASVFIAQAQLLPPALVSSKKVAAAVTIPPQTESVTAFAEVTGTTSPTLAAATAAGANGYMHFIITTETLSGQCTAVVRNSESFTRIGGATNGTQWLQIWELKNPSSGSHTITATLDNSFRVGMGAINYTNVNQTTPVGTPVVATGNDTTHAHNVTTGANDLTLDYMLWGACASLAANSGQTETINSTINWSFVSSTEPGTGGAVSVGSNHASGARDYGHWSVDLNPP